MKYTSQITYSNRTEWIFDKIVITFYERLTKENKKIINYFLNLADIEFHPQLIEKITETEQKHGRESELTEMRYYQGYLDGLKVFLSDCNE